MTPKEILYDWFGGNLALFHFLNGHHFPALEPLFLLFAHIFEYTAFPYYFAAIVMLAALAFAFRRLRGRAIDRPYVRSWIGLLLVLVVGYVGMVVMVAGLKGFFAMPRPFVALKESIWIIGPLPEESKYYASLPSGHAAFTAFLFAALWPKLQGLGRTIGVLLIAAVAYSRVAMGMHFPADVVWAALLSVIIVLVVRRIVYRVFSVPYY